MDHDDDDDDLIGTRHRSWMPNRFHILVVGFVTLDALDDDDDDDDDTWYHHQRLVPKIRSMALDDYQ
jgi:hypothetical protein